MLDEDINYYGLAGSVLLYAEDSTEAYAAFARDC
jgi:hypothetical protein